MRRGGRRHEGPGSNVRLGRGEGGAGVNGEKPWRYRGPRVNAWQQEHADMIAAIRADRPYHEGW